jgi:hypothetical protein
MKCDLKKIERIVAYGCSFTWGSELADHDFIPNMTVEQVDQEKRSLGYEKFYKTYAKYYDKDNSILRSKLENDRSWISTFGKFLNKPVINRSKPGSSNRENIYMLEKDIKNNRVSERDLVILGFTSKERLFYFTELGLHESLTYNENDQRWPNKDMRKLFIENFVNDFFTAYELYIDILHFDWLRKASNLNLYGQYVHSTFNENFTFDMNKNVDFCMVSQNINKVECIINKDMSFGWPPLEWHKKENQHGFIHPKVEIQDKFAERIAESFKENFLI